MKIVILNGDARRERSDFSEYISQLAQQLEVDHSVQTFYLNEMDLHFCTGCWSCWWKTPGDCAIHDDAIEIFRSIIHSDFFIFASPLVAGFTTSLLKKVTDRLIILLHPYIEIRNGENHHRKRYEKYPEFGLVLEKEEGTDQDDLQIISDIYDRLALNFHSRKKYMKLIDQHKIEEVVYETCHF